KNAQDEWKKALDNQQKILDEWGITLAELKKLMLETGIQSRSKRGN
ncbi:unnamed protein product, partial [marine sediment metagenome]